MKLSRRRLTAHAASSVPLALLARLARAQAGRTELTRSEPDAHFFLFIQVYGAWDVCLAFDPKDRDTLLPTGGRQYDQPYAISEVRDFRGIPLAPAGHVLGRYADRMAIVNGIDMEVDGGHTSDIVMTGHQTARATNAPYVQAMLAKKVPFLKRRAVPHLFTAYDGQFIGGPYGLSSITAAPADFLSVIGGAGGSGSPTATLRAMLADYQGSLPSAASRRTFATYIGAADRAGQVARSLSDFGFDPPDDIAAPEGLGSFIGQMFASGVVGSATLSLGSKYVFDTHSDHYAQHPLGTALTDMDHVIQALAQVRLDDQLSVLDRTTVVFTGEYTRTPLLNGDGGKDHNFRTNSLVVLGHRVRPGVYGASGARREGSGYENHAGLPMDLATGRPSDTGEILYARNLWAGFGALAGVDLASEFPVGTRPAGFFG